MSLCDQKQLAAAATSMRVREYLSKLSADIMMTGLRLHHGGFCFESDDLPLAHIEMARGMVVGRPQTDAVPTFFMSW